MSDFSSALPVKTESPGDLIVKLADATTPSQQLAIAANGSINANVSATNLDIRDLVFATDKVDVSGSTGLVAVVSATNLDIRDLVFATDKVDVSGSSVTVTAADLDIRNLSQSQDSVKVGDGTDFLAVNADGSINVVLSSVAASSVCDYKDAAAIAAAGTDNHDYTVTAGKTLTLRQIESSASGKAKMVLAVETGVATGVFTTRAVQFNSTATPNSSLVLDQPISVAAGVKVRVTMSNRDAQAQDLYSSIIGSEI